MYPSLRNAIACLSLCMLALALSVTGRPATFLEDFRVTWADTHIKQIDSGRATQLILDRNSGNTLRGVTYIYIYILSI